jgi:hypothetical protein
MPKSKHRRKPGGKAVRHPGRGKPPRKHAFLDAEMALWRRFRAGYEEPFNQRHGDHDAVYMLDLIADAAFVPNGEGSLQPVSKAEIFREFMEPPDFDPALPAGEPPPKHETLETAEAALAFLVEQGMVEVAGDEIVVPAHFWTGGAGPAA